MKLDAQDLGAVNHRETVDVRKLSSLVGPGLVLETVDGRIFRVVSKVASHQGTTYTLENHDGAFAVTAARLAEMEPLPSGIARLAHLIRLYAYNKDFDQYVKEAIRAHGLPVDKTMNWSKWFQAIYAPMLGEYMKSKGLSVSEDAIDEIIHAVIIDSLYARDSLSKFPKKTQKGYSEGRARQVTKFLSNLFNYEKTRAMREAVRGGNVMPTREQGGEGGRGRAVPMMQPGETGEEVNILDTFERAERPQYGVEEESWEDVATFRAEYADWLKRDKEASTETANNIIKLFDLIINAERTAGDEASQVTDYRLKWMEETGKSLSYFGVIATKLSETLQKFVEVYPELAETSLIARLIADIKTKKPTTKSRVEGPKSVPVAASLNLVAIAPSELAEIPGDTGRIPHGFSGNDGNTSNAVILLDEKPAEQPRTVAPEIPAIKHGF
ncbi:Uncharacterised protein [uncultured archaeon]|nr:Uncharacterised protein [uncultured archaeon]